MEVDFRSHKNLRQNHCIYLFRPWEWRTPGVVDPGSGGSWEWRTLGVAGEWWASTF